MNNMSNVDKKLGKELDRQSLQVYNTLNKMSVAAYMEGDLILSNNLNELMIYVYNKGKKGNKRNEAT
jgi:hypothetical protein